MVTSLGHQVPNELSDSQSALLWQLEYDDIAEVMGLSRQSVANLLHRTLRTLRERWPVSFLLLIQLLYTH